MGVPGELTGDGGPLQAAASPLPPRTTTGRAPPHPEQVFNPSGRGQVWGQASWPRPREGLPCRARPGRGEMGKKLTAAGGFCWGGRETDRQSALSGALLLSRRGEEMALPALQYRRVCAAGAGGEGREGRG